MWDRVDVHLLKLLNRAGELEQAVAIVDHMLERAFGGESTVPSRCRLH